MAAKQKKTSGASKTSASKRSKSKASAKTEKESKAEKTAKTARTTKSAKTEKTQKPETAAKKAAEKDMPERDPLISNEVQGVLSIALGLLLACLFFVPSSGVVGEFVRNVCCGLFGAASSIFFVFFLIAGIRCFIKRDTAPTYRKWWIVLALMLFSGVVYALIMNDLSFVGGGFVSNINELYDNGVSGHGGGIIGGLVCKGLVFAIGYWGTWICSLAAVIVLLMTLTGISVSDTFKKLAAGIVRLKNKHAAKRAQKQAEKESRRVVESLNPENNVKNKRRSRGTEKTAKGDKTQIDIPLDDTVNTPHTTDVKPQRFVVEEDENMSRTLRSSLNTEPSAKRFSLDDLPFDIGDIAAGTISEDNGAEVSILNTGKTGALTKMPNADGTIPKDEDPDDFEPPSEAKLADKPDPATRLAMEAGVPFDEAVTKGRKMMAEREFTPQEKVAAEVEEAKKAERLIPYSLPSTDLLSESKPKKQSRTELRRELEEKANRLLETLNSFKVEAKIINITQGPSVTRFELQPGFGVKVSKITGLSDDIALSLAAPGVRIEAPIPGKSAIGIEIPNSSPSSVPIREVLDTPEFKHRRSKTTVALGKDISGSCVIADIADFPHILIAGATGSGKSVCINSLITSILYKAKPDEVKMIMVDPKMVELGVYNGIPHLLIPVVTDPKHAAGALNWAVVEMQNRYTLLKDNKVRNLSGFNKLMDEQGTPELKLPEIVIIIDELADLMNVAKSEVEEAINRLAALARAAGMYLVIATQRPSVNVITGVIKANIPSRIAFAVSQQVDSRTIIDSAGAEKLLGKGDMLYSPRGSLKPIRVQGNFVSDAEIEALVGFIKSQYEAEYDENVIEHIEKEQERVSADIEAASAPQHSGGNSGKVDDMFIEAAELVLENGQASVAMLQRKFKMGYQRAAKLIDQMEELGVIGPYEGTKPRQVLITRQELNEMKYNRSSN